jgi:hypothetical protein
MNSGSSGIDDVLVPDLAGRLDFVPEALGYAGNIPPAGRQCQSL